MPKLIPELENNILSVSKQILLEEGFDALSMRRVARDCNIAVGTLYNYFESKDELIAKITMDEWHYTLVEIENAASAASSFPEGVLSIYSHLSDFVAKYRSSWSQNSGGYQSFSNSYRKRLIKQLSHILQELMTKNGKESLLPLGPILAETILSTVSNSSEYSEGLKLLAELLSE